MTVFSAFPPSPKPRDSFPSVRSITSAHPAGSAYFPLALLHLLGMAEPPAKRARRTDSSAMWEKDEARPKRQSNGGGDSRGTRDDRRRHDGDDEESHRSRGEPEKRGKDYTREGRGATKDRSASPEQDSRRRRERGERVRGGDRDRRPKERSRSRERQRPRKGT